MRGGTELESGQVSRSHAELVSVIQERHRRSGVAPVSHNHTRVRDEKWPHAWSLTSMPSPSREQQAGPRGQQAQLDGGVHRITSVGERRRTPWKTRTANRRGAEQPAVGGGRPGRCATPSGVTVLRLLGRVNPPARHHGEVRPTEIRPL